MKVVKARNGHGTVRAENLPDKRLFLLFPLSEAQVDWGTWAKQAMSLCLDITSERRHRDMELLNDLPKGDKKKTHTHTEM